VDAATLPRPRGDLHPAEDAAPSVDGAVTVHPVPVPAAAEAVVVADRSSGWQERMGAAALARLDYPWQRLGFRVEFLPGRSGYLGMTFPERRVIEMYVRDSESVDELARNTGHELGHALDWVQNTAASRGLYQEIRGIDPGRGWFACRGCTDLSTPAGDFAETFSYWLMAGAFPDRSLLAAAPDPVQLARLAPLFHPPDVHTDS
jgi:hypothetical protein